MMFGNVLFFQMWCQKIVLLQSPPDDIYWGAENVFVIEHNECLGSILKVLVLKV